MCVCVRQSRPRLDNEFSYTLIAVLLFTVSKVLTNTGGSGKPGREQKGKLLLFCFVLFFVFFVVIINN